MEIAGAVIVFGLLLAIALYGLAYSNRQAERNDASRHARPAQGRPVAGSMGQTVHPADQQIRSREAAPPRDRS